MKLLEHYGMARVRNIKCIMILTQLWIIDVLLSWKALFINLYLNLLSFAWLFYSHNVTFQKDSIRYMNFFKKTTLSAPKINIFYLKMYNH